MHLALSRLGRVEQPAEAARRLFMADGLMRAGVEPEAILEALGLGPSDEPATQKYSPNQPRVPSGSGRPSGEWVAALEAAAAGLVGASVADARNALHAFGGVGIRTAGASAALGQTAAGLDLRAMSGRALTGLVGFITGLTEGATFTTTLAAGGTVAVLGVLFIPSNSARGVWVKVGGPGNISYFHNPDELHFLFRYTSPDGVQYTVGAFPGPGGEYRGPDGRTIARWVKTGATVGLVVSTAALMGRDTGEPQLCPAAKPDRNTTDRGRLYEDFMKARLNPGSPTPSGLSYYFGGGMRAIAVSIDDCQQKTGALAEYKGPGFEKAMLKGGKPWEWYEDDIMNQALRQVEVKGDRPLIWFFAEKSVADHFRQEFAHSARSQIVVDWVPYRESAK